MGERKGMTRMPYFVRKPANRERKTIQGGSDPGSLTTGQQFQMVCRRRLKESSCETLEKTYFSLALVRTLVFYSGFDQLNWITFTGQQTFRIYRRALKLLLTDKTFILLVNAFALLNPDACLTIVTICL